MAQFDPSLPSDERERLESEEASAIAIAVEASSPDVEIETDDSDALGAEEDDVNDQTDLLEEEEPETERTKRVYTPYVRPRDKKGRFTKKKKPFDPDSVNTADEEQAQEETGQIGGFHTEEELRDMDVPLFQELLMKAEKYYRDTTEENPPDPADRLAWEMARQQKQNTFDNSEAEQLNKEQEKAEATVERQRVRNEKELERQRLRTIRRQLAHPQIDVNVDEQGEMDVSIPRGFDLEVEMGVMKSEALKSGSKGQTVLREKQGLYQQELEYKRFLLHKNDDFQKMWDGKFEDEIAVEAESDDIWEDVVAAAYTPESESTGRQESGPVPQKVTRTSKYKQAAESAFDELINDESIETSPIQVYKLAKKLGLLDKLKQKMEDFEFEKLIEIDKKTEAYSEYKASPPVDEQRKIIPRESRFSKLKEVSGLSDEEIQMFENMNSQEWEARYENPSLEEKHIKLMDQAFGKKKASLQPEPEGNTPSYTANSSPYSMDDEDHDSEHLMQDMRHNPIDRGPFGPIR
jgi:hypothetical protein